MLVSSTLPGKRQLCILVAQALVIESVRLAAAKSLLDPLGLQQVFQARMRECRILTQRTEPTPDMWPNILVSYPTCIPSFLTPSLQSSLVRPSVCSFVGSFVHLFIHSFIYAFIHRMRYS